MGWRARSSPGGLCAASSQGTRTLSMFVGLLESLSRSAADATRRSSIAPFHRPSPAARSPFASFASGVSPQPSRSCLPRWGPPLPCGSGRGGPDATSWTASGEADCDAPMLLGADPRPEQHTGRANLHALVTGFAESCSRGGRKCVVVCGPRRFVQAASSAHTAVCAKNSGSKLTFLDVTGGE